jgi:hypothetical protein
MHGRARSRTEIGSEKLLMFHSYGVLMEQDTLLLVNLFQFTRCESGIMLAPYARRRCFWRWPLPVPERFLALQIPANQLSIHNTRQCITIGDIVLVACATLSRWPRRTTLMASRLGLRRKTTGFVWNWNPSLAAFWHEFHLVWPNDVLGLLEIQWHTDAASEGFYLYLATYLGILLNSENPTRWAIPWCRVSWSRIKRKLFQKVLHRQRQDKSWKVGRCGSLFSPENSREKGPGGGCVKLRSDGRELCFLLIPHISSAVCDGVTGREAENQRSDLKLRRCHHVPQKLCEPHLGSRVKHETDENRRSLSPGQCIL